MTATYLRQSTMADLPAVLDVIHSAKAYLKEQGVDQWQHGYPYDEDMEQDIKNGYNYVLMVDGQVAGTATLHQGLDENYMVIEDGTWINGIDAPYTAIHRIAVSGNYRGQHLSEKLISGLLSISGVLGFHDVRIDTSPENTGMQHVITANGFQRRGTIFMHEPKEPRFAYQLILN